MEISAKRWEVLHALARKAAWKLAGRDQVLEADDIASAVLIALVEREMGGETVQSRSLIYMRGIDVLRKWTHGKREHVRKRKRRLRDEDGAWLATPATQFAEAAVAERVQRQPLCPGPPAYQGPTTAGEFHRVWG